VTSTSAIKRLTRKLAEMASELTLAVETVGAELQFAPLLDSIEQLNRQTAELFLHASHASGSSDSASAAPAQPGALISLALASQQVLYRAQAMDAALPSLGSSDTALVSPRAPEAVSRPAAAAATATHVAAAELQRAAAQQAMERDRYATTVALLASFAHD